MLYTKNTLFPALYLNGIAKIIFFHLVSALKQAIFEILIIFAEIFIFS